MMQHVTEFVTKAEQIAEGMVCNPRRSAVDNVIRLITDRIRKLYCCYGILGCDPATGEFEIEID